MIYLVYRMKLTARSRADLEAFWRWAKEREVWFFTDLPMVKSLRWYQSVIGDVYTLENWAAFDDIEGYGAYRRKLTELRARPAWERKRVTQDRYWEFLDTRLFSDTPLAGFPPLSAPSPRGRPSPRSRARPRRR
jgi:hypothetical protein